MRGGFRAVAAVSAVALALAGCGFGDTGDDTPKKSFTAQLKEPVDLIPGGTNEIQGSTVEQLLFAGLTSYDDKTGESVNEVAKSLRSSPDKRVWTVELKEGWRFSNGEQVTSQSFVGAWNATVHNGWRNSYFFTDLLKIQGAADAGPAKKKSEMSGLQVVDENTFKITLDQPNNSLPLIVGYTAFFPVPESVLESENWKKYRERPIGNGQYTMAEPWEHHKYIKLAKNPGYSGMDKGRADEITFRIYSNPTTAYSDAASGNLDIANAPPSRLASAPEDFPDRYVTTEGSTFVYLGLPLWKDGYDDVRVRKAISMAIDREQIADVLFNETVTPAKGLISPLIKIGRRKDPCGSDCEFDPRKASSLFEEAGALDGKPVELWYDTGAGNEDWVEAVAGQLKRNLGVEVELKSVPWNRYPDITQQHKVTGPYRLGWIMDYPAPENYLAPLYSSKGSSNGTKYSNDKVDELLDKGIAAKAPEAGVASYHQAEDQILDDMPVVPLWFQKQPYVYSPHVGNLTFDSLGFPRYDQVEVND